CFREVHSVTFYQKCGEILMLERLLLPFYEQLERSHHSLKLLYQEWELFEGKNTYLTYRDMQQFTTSLMSHHPKTIRYFLFKLFFDDTHKIILTEYAMLVSQLQERITTYNERFIE